MNQGTHMVRPCPALSWPYSPRHAEDCENLTLLCAMPCTCDSNSNEAESYELVWGTEVISQGTQRVQEGTQRVPLSREASQFGTDQDLQLNLESEALRRP